MNFDHHSLQICKKEETNDELRIRRKVEILIEKNENI